VAKIKYSADIMKFMSLFESMTGARVKDCLVNDVVTFIVHESEMGKAIGKKGSNIRRLENVLKKRIKLVEFNSDVSKFASNLTYPLKLKDVNEEDGVVTLHAEDTKTRGILIGRDRKNIRSINDIVKRYFKVNEVIVS
jgi:transcription termination/antitermination protein NusA